MPRYLFPLAATEVADESMMSSRFNLLHVDMDLKAVKAVGCEGLSIHRLLVQTKRGTKKIETEGRLT